MLPSAYLHLLHLLRYRTDIYAARISLLLLETEKERKLTELDKFVGDSAVLYLAQELGNTESVTSIESQVPRNCG